MKQYCMLLSFQRFQSEIDRLKNNEKNVEQRSRVKETKMDKRIEELEEKLQKQELEKRELHDNAKKLEAKNKQLNEQLAVTQVGGAEVTSSYIIF